MVVAYISTVGLGPKSFLAPLVFALTVYVFSFESGAVSALFKTRFLLMLGTLSYSIYMVHAFVLLIFDNVTAVAGKLLGAQLTVPLTLNGKSYHMLDYGNPWVMDAVMLVYVALVIAGAALCFRYVEAPGYELAKRLTGRRPGRVEKPALQPETRG
jgi:peptidoglycan/LPS O-acetylase OafA/YrhL